MVKAMTISEAAERVLFGQSLEEKLHVSPLELADTGRHPAIATPDCPTRPSEMQLSESGVRASFPGVNQLDQDKPRGEMLHFLANHELLASELMALVLLKFPDAPDEYRRGVYEAMREEQMHTLMYMRRMKDCGIEFGQLPLNSYFWRLVSPMKSPMEFVTKLNLTFEQANLDFSRHYAALFRQVGDNSTAAVLEKIYQDEIGHVGHGIKWLREWKDPKQSDWTTYCQGLELPFSASKAKGMAPYNPEGRRAAGLDEEFISKLAVYSQSRGRNPIAHWFNPNAEKAALLGGKNTTLSKNERAIESDLELLMLPLCKQDDLLLVRHMPSTEHLTALRDHGVTIPELLEYHSPELLQRKLGGLRPWAWSPDSSHLLSPLADQVPASVPDQWQAPRPPQLFSKESAVTLKNTLAIPHQSILYTDSENACQRLVASPSPLRLKAPFSCSGRGHFRYRNADDLSKAQQFIERTIAQQQSVLIEPERDKVCDFSVQYELHKGTAKLKGFCVIDNTPAGQFQQARVSQKWTSLLPPEVPAFLFTTADIPGWYNERIPAALAELYPEYSGPLGIDSMVYRDAQGELALETIVEINPRYTMGRVALESLKMLNLYQGALTILPISQPPPADSIPLTDATRNHTLIAYFKKSL